MEVERVPLTREETRLEEYKAQQNAWRALNSQMTTLRESTRSLYSYDNPFSSKIASSTDEYAITADPGRDASFDSFKIEVLQTATSDRFLSSELASNTQVPEGQYIFRVNEKKVTLNWKGGNLTDFVSAINRRSPDTVKASLIGITSNTKALLIESPQTGAENRLIFEGAAESFAQEIGMIQRGPAESGGDFPLTTSTIANTGNLTSKTIEISDTALSLPPQSGFEAKIPGDITAENENIIQFSASLIDVPAEAPLPTDPTLPSAGIVQFKGVTLANETVDPSLPEISTPTPIAPVEDYSAVFVKTTSGAEIPLSNLNANGQSSNFSIRIADYPDLESVIIKNNNTHKNMTLSPFEVTNPTARGDYVPVNPVEVAQDAKIKYQGITMTRPTNTIDDVVPSVTLNIHNVTERPATVTIDPDTETAKDSLITFVAQYNRLVAELNILSQTNPDIISEISYFSDAEVEAANEKLGMFSSDFAVRNAKSTLQQIVSNPYPSTDDSTLTMLSQIGISTGASSGFSGVTSSRLRGYLEIDESALDTALKSDIVNIKNIFGYDSDGDLVIDTGLAYLMDRNLQTFTQTGGIIATKNSTLATQIGSSEAKIATLEEKLVDTESNLQVKYGRMEQALNNLESQSSTISNFSNSLNNSNR